MNEKIRAIVVERVRNRPQFRIDRSKTGDGPDEQAKELMLDHVTSSLKGIAMDLYDDRDRIEMSSLSQESVKAPVSFGTVHQMEKRFLQEVTTGLQNSARTFDLKIKLGDQVMAPPYDKDWSVGAGVGFLSRFDGNVYALNQRDYSAAGIGFYLSSDVPALVSIVPWGDYKWSYIAFENSPFVRSRGGMGVTVYTDSNSTPTHNNQPILWNVSGLNMLEGKTGSGRIADAASPAFGFGSVPLAPVLISMVPGSKYLVWVWCWQVYNNNKDEGFFAIMDFHMPLVTVSAGPPILLH